MAAKKKERIYEGMGRTAIDPSENLVQLAIPMTIEVQLVTTCKIDEIPLLKEVLTKGLEEMREMFADNDYQLFVREGVVRPATQLEVQDLLPRKIHLRDPDDPERWLCSTAHVSLKNLTGKAEEVTCRLCQWAVKNPPKKQAAGGEG